MNKKVVILVNLIVGTFLTNAMCDPWTFKTIEIEPQGTQGIGVALFSNSNGYNAICYTVNQNHNDFVKVALNPQTTSWSITTVTSGAESYVGLSPTIWSNSNAQGNPLDVTYLNGSPGAIYHATFSATGVWNIEPIANNSIGSFTNSPIQPADKTTCGGEVNIGFNAFTNVAYGLQLGKEQSFGNWTFETIDSSGTFGYYATMFLDGNNTPRVSYTKSNNLYYATEQCAGSPSSTGWTISTVIPNIGFVPNTISVLQNGIGQPAILYAQMSNGVPSILNLAIKSSTSPAWLPSEIVYSKGSNISNPVFGDRGTSGYIYVAFADATKGRIIQARRPISGGTWEYEEIASINSSGQLFGFGPFSGSLSPLPSEQVAFIDAYDNNIKFGGRDTSSFPPQNLAVNSVQNQQPLNAPAAPSSTVTITAEVYASGFTNQPGQAPDIIGEIIFQGIRINMGTYIGKSADGLRDVYQGSVYLSSSIVSGNYSYITRFSATNGQPWVNSGVSGSIIVDTTTPSMLSAKTNTVSSINVYFNKILDSSTVVASDFSVSSFTVTNAVQTTTGVVTLSISPAMATDALPIVTLQGGARDLGGTLALTGTVTATDGIPPQVLSIVTSPSSVIFNTGVNGLRITTVFSESMSTSVNPTVTYTPTGSGGALLTCSQVPTWSTTTKTNDTYSVGNDTAIGTSTLDGPTVLNVSGGLDLAQNVMASSATTFQINVNKLIIQNTLPTPGDFDPYANETTTASYVLSEPALNVSVVVTDTFSVIVSTLLSNVSQPVGLSGIVWDGTTNGVKVSTSQNPKTYYIKITANSGETPVSDPTVISFATVTVNSGIPSVENNSDSPEPLPINSTSTIKFDTYYYNSGTTLKSRLIVNNSSGVPVYNPGTWSNIGSAGTGRTTLWYSTGPEGIYQYQLNVRAGPTQVSDPKYGVIRVVNVDTATNSSTDNNITIYHAPSFNMTITTTVATSTMTFALNTTTPSVYLESPLYTITPGAGFIAPVIMYFNYNPALEGSNLQIMKWNGTSWTTAGINQYVDLANNRIVAQVYTFSVFAIVSKQPAAPVPIGWVGNQTPMTSSIYATSNLTVYCDVWSNGLTGQSGAPAKGIIGEIWSNVSGTWAKLDNMVYNANDGNNDQYKAVVGPFPSGSYQYICRFSGDGGNTWTWSTTGNASLTVNSVSIGWVGNQSPMNPSIYATQQLTVYCQVWSNGLTGQAGHPAPGILSELWSNYTGTWQKLSDMVYDTNVGNNDQYKSTVGPFVSGNYQYIARFSGDGGITWTWSSSGNASLTVLSVPIGWVGNQSPMSLTVSLGNSGAIVADVWSNGLTGQNGVAAPGIIGQLWTNMSGTWASVPMTYLQKDGNNDQYQGFLVPSSTGSFQYIARFSGDGGVTWTYSSSGNGQLTAVFPSVTSVGNTNQWSNWTNPGLETVGPYKNGAYIWFNSQSYPHIVDPFVHVEAIYTTNNWATLTVVPLSRNGTAGNNDAWHQLIGPVNSSYGPVNFQYYIHAYDMNGDNVYDNNNYSNFSFTVQAPPYLTLDFPQQNEVITSPTYSIRIGASATTNNVMVSIDGGPMSQCYFSSGYWWFSWGNYPHGNHSMYAQGWDSLGQTSQTSITYCSYP